MRYKSSKVPEILKFLHYPPDSFSQISFINFYKYFMAKLDLYMIELKSSSNSKGHNFSMQLLHGPESCLSYRGLHISFGLVKVMFYHSFLDQFLIFQ